MNIEVKEKIIAFFLKKSNSLRYLQGLRRLKLMYGEVISYRYSFHRLYKYDNLYLVSTQKMGSQWIRKVFEDFKLSRWIKLRCYPQKAFDFGEMQYLFPRNTVVPGMYISFDEFSKISNALNKGYILFIMRKPTDVIISWYYSMLNSHLPINKHVILHRQKLSELNLEEGILYTLQNFKQHFDNLFTWYEQLDRHNVKCVVFSELVSRPDLILSELFDDYGIKIDSSRLVQVLDQYKKEQMRERDLLRKANDKTSQYSKGNKKWNEILTPKIQDYYNLHYKEIEKLYDKVFIKSKESHC